MRSPYITTRELPVLAASREKLSQQRRPSTAKIKKEAETGGTLFGDTWSHQKLEEA